MAEPEEHGTPKWFPTERRHAPRVAEQIGLILQQNELISAHVAQAMAVAHDARELVAENRKNIERAAECYDRHVADSQWMQDMRSELQTLIDAMKFILTLQKAIVWASKAAAGIAAFVGAFVVVSDFIMPWVHSLLNAHRPPPP